MKKTTFFVLIFIVLFAGILAACQSTAEPIRIGEKDAGKTITMKTGDTLLVELDGNVTTGFNWILAPQNPVLLSQLDEAKVTPESSRIGAPGKIVLSFKAVAQGQAALHLDYKRPWEKNITPTKTFEVTLIVK